MTPTAEKVLAVLSHDHSLLPHEVAARAQVTDLVAAFSALTELQGLGLAKRTSKRGAMRNQPWVRVPVVDVL